RRIRPSPQRALLRRYASTTGWALFLRLGEMAQVRRRLAFSHGHQQAVGAEVIDFLADANVRVILGADELAPDRPRVGIAAQIPVRGPWPGRRLVVARDLVMQALLVIFVEIDALFEPRLVVVVRRRTRRIVMARSLETTGLDFQHVVFSIAVLVDPFADGI